MEPIQQPQENQAQPNQNNYRTNYTLPLSILIASIIIGAGLFFGLRNNQLALAPASKVDQVASEVIINPITKDDHIMGNPNAKIVMVEFSDTECPYCKIFHKTLHQVMDKYGKDGQVAWVYRHFPIDKLHSKARKEAEATECANELGGNDAFWKYIDSVYTKTGSNNTLEDKELPTIAKEIGLDVTKFDACLSSGKYADKVESQYQDAVKAGGRGTPYTVLVTKDGKLPISDGALPFAQISSIIDQLLVLTK